MLYNTIQQKTPVLRIINNQTYQLNNNIEATA